MECDGSRVESRRASRITLASAFEGLHHTLETFFASDQLTASIRDE